MMEVSMWCTWALRLRFVVCVVRINHGKIDLIPVPYCIRGIAMEWIGLRNGSTVVSGMRGVWMKNETKLTDLEWSSFALKMYCSNNMMEMNPGVFFWIAEGLALWWNISNLWTSEKIFHSRAFGRVSKLLLSLIRMNMNDCVMIMAQEVWLRKQLGYWASSSMKHNKEWDTNAGTTG